MKEKSVQEFVRLCLVKNKNAFHRVITSQALYMMYFYFIRGDYKRDDNTVVPYKVFLKIIRNLLSNNIILYKGETSNFVIYDYMCRFDFMRERNNLGFDFNFPTDIYRATSRLQNLDGIYITLPQDPAKDKQQKKVEEYFDYQGETTYTTELKNNQFLSYEEVSQTEDKIPRPLTSCILYNRKTKKQKTGATTEEI